ncbi:MAG: integrase core domain-containing protein [Pedobacter sp.]
MGLCKWGRDAFLARPGKPMDRVLLESFNDSLREEWLYTPRFLPTDDAWVF